MISPALIANEWRDPRHRLDDRKSQAADLNGVDIDMHRKARKLLCRNIAHNNSDERRWRSYFEVAAKSFGRVFVAIEPPLAQDRHQFICDHRQTIDQPVRLQVEAIDGASVEPVLDMVC